MSEPVTIKILDREFVVGCAPEEREALVSAARFVDEQARDIRSGNRLAAFDRILALAALNIASELQNLKGHSGQQDDSVLRSISDLNIKLETLLKTVPAR